MADPITTLLGTHSLSELRDYFNQNFTRRHWRDATAADIDDTDSPYAVADADEYLRVDANAAAVTVTLPDVATNAGRVLWVEALDVSFTVTIDGDGANVNGSSSKTIGTAGRLAVVHSDGTAWTAWYMDRLP